MACLIDPRFEALIDDALADEATVASFHRLGEHLQSGGNVINAVPHGPLLDIGLLHAMAYIALSRLGYAPKMGIVISHGISGRGKRFGDDLVCLADALDWAMRQGLVRHARAPRTYGSRRTSSSCRASASRSTTPPCGRTSRTPSTSAAMSLPRHRARPAIG